MGTDDDEILCIRALTGPLSGSVYLLADRLEIGRASSSDVQLVTTGVSRTHAVVMHGEEGYALLDMLSTNGTWVGEERVQHHTLQIGDVFRIGDSEFSFERFTEGEQTGSELERIVDGRVQRPTLRFEKAVQAKKVTATQECPTTMKATAEDGSPYPGNLLADIVLYRNLRIKEGRMGELAAALRKRFGQLDQQLRRAPTSSDDPANQRAFARFTVQIPGKLAFEDSRTQDFGINLLDIAVDGARTTAPSRAADINALCWLSLPMLGPKGLRTVVFTGRIVWTREDEIGLVFSGAPSWASRNKDREEQETQPLGQLSTVKKLTVTGGG